MGPYRKPVRTEGSKAAPGVATESGDARSRGRQNPTGKPKGHGQRTRPSRVPCRMPGLARCRKKGSSSRHRLDTVWRSHGVLISPALLSVDYRLWAHQRETPVAHA